MNPLPPTAVVAVIGAGTMGSGIAQVAAQAGHRVLLFDAAEHAAVQGHERIGRDLERLVKRERISAELRQQILDHIQPVPALADLVPAALVIEVIVERLDIKQQVFAELESLCGQDTILASNTSSLSITAIGAALQRPERLVGMHFFNPAPVMKLVEVISGLATDPQVAACIHATAATWGKTPVHARSTPGFIVNRVARPFYAEALRILQEGGCDVATVDALMREAGGFRMGPFQLMDLIGHDVNFAVTRSVFEAYYNDPRFLPSLIQQELVAAGWLGRKSGRGFYDYAEGAETPQPTTAETAPAPQQITIRGSLGVAESLLERSEAAGIRVLRGPARRSAETGLIEVGTARLALSDGRHATVRCSTDDLENLLTFDLALDYAKASRIALAAADQTTAEAVQAAVGLFQALGKTVSLIDDVPGMVVLRTVAMLANEAADAVNQQVADGRDVDAAMQAGVNYPQGPLAWADAIGLERVLAVLEGLAASYGEDRYRASPLLRRRLAAGRPLIECT